MIVKSFAASTTLLRKSFSEHNSEHREKGFFVFVLACFFGKSMYPHAPAKRAGQSAHRAAESLLLLMAVVVEGKEEECVPL